MQQEGNVGYVANLLSECIQKEVLGKEDKDYIKEIFKNLIENEDVFESCYNAAHTADLIAECVNTEILTKDDFKDNKDLIHKIVLTCKDFDSNSRNISYCINLYKSFVEKGIPLEILSDDLGKLTKFLVNQCYAKVKNNDDLKYVIKSDMEYLSNCELTEEAIEAHIDTITGDSIPEFRLQAFSECLSEYLDKEPSNKNIATTMLKNILNKAPYNYAQSPVCKTICDAIIKTGKKFGVETIIDSIENDEKTENGKAAIVYCIKQAYFQDKEYESLTEDKKKELKDLLTDIDKIDKKVLSGYDSIKEFMRLVDTTPAPAKGDDVDEKKAKDQNAMEQLKASIIKKLSEIIDSKTNDTDREELEELRGVLTENQNYFIFNVNIPDDLKDEELIDNLLTYMNKKCGIYDMRKETMCKNFTMLLKECIQNKQCSEKFIAYFFNEVCEHPECLKKNQICDDLFEAYKNAQVNYNYRNIDFLKKCMQYYPASVMKNIGSSEIYDKNKQDLVDIYRQEGIITQQNIGATFNRLSELAEIVIRRENSDDTIIDIILNTVKENFSSLVISKNKSSILGFSDVGLEAFNHKCDSKKINGYTEEQLKHFRRWKSLSSDIIARINALDTQTPVESSLPHNVVGEENDEMNRLKDNIKNALQEVSDSNIEYFLENFDSIDTLTGQGQYGLSESIQLYQYVCEKKPEIACDLFNYFVEKIKECKDTSLADKLLGEVLYSLRYGTIDIIQGFEKTIISFLDNFDNFEKDLNKAGKPKLEEKTVELYILARDKYSYKNKDLLKLLLKSNASAIKNFRSLYDETNEEKFDSIYGEDGIIKELVDIYSEDDVITKDNVPFLLNSLNDGLKGSLISDKKPNKADILRIILAKVKENSSSLITSSNKDGVKQALTNIKDFPYENEKNVMKEITGLVEGILSDLENINIGEKIPQIQPEVSVNVPVQQPAKDDASLEECKGNLSKALKDYKKDKNPEAQQKVINAFYDLIINHPDCDLNEYEDIIISLSSALNIIAKLAEIKCDDSQQQYNAIITILRLISKYKGCDDEEQLSSIDEIIGNLFETKWAVRHDFQLLELINEKIKDIPNIDTDYIHTLCKETAAVLYEPDIIIYSNDPKGCDDNFVFNPLENAIQEFNSDSQEIGSLKELLSKEGYDIKSKDAVLVLRQLRAVLVNDKKVTENPDSAKKLIKCILGKYLIEPSIIEEDNVEEVFKELQKKILPLCNELDFEDSTNIKLMINVVNVLKQICSTIGTSESNIISFIKNYVNNIDKKLGDLQEYDDTMSLDEKEELKQRIDLSTESKKLLDAIDKSDFTSLCDSDYFEDDITSLIDEGSDDEEE